MIKIFIFCIFLPFTLMANDSLELELKRSFENDDESIEQIVTDKKDQEEDNTNFEDDTTNEDGKISETSTIKNVEQKSEDAIVNENEQVDPKSIEDHARKNNNPSSADDDENNSNANMSNFKTIATLQGINKITTDISIFKVAVNGSTTFGNLTIRVGSCWKAPSDLKKENKILLRISENIPGENNVKDVFYGWMLSSSPALSTLNHPVYDIIAINCSSE